MTITIHNYIGRLLVKSCEKQTNKKQAKKKKLKKTLKTSCVASIGNKKVAVLVDHHQV